ncbi:MAG: alpha/beta fold hydrolase [bacterium]|nr:alpha/beta fold hydrolase [bacterium]
MKKVNISVGQGFIKGTLFYPKKIKNKNPAIIFIHGWNSDESGYRPRAEALASLGYICLTISLRGHGESSGKLEEFSRQDHLQDIIKAYDFLTSQKEVDLNNINVVGASYGAYLGAILTTKRKVVSLAMRAPALFPNAGFSRPTIDLIRNIKHDLIQNALPETDNFALIGINQVNHVILIESERDQIIPHAIIALYKNAISDKTKLTNKIIKGAGHHLSEEKWKQEFITILREWFGKQIF